MPERQSEKPKTESLTEALVGLVVIEYGQLISAPYCGKMLADLGATVIKVESPENGDLARREGPFPGHVPHPEKSGLFLYLNSNKVGLTLNLTEPEGLAIFRRLLSTADILVHNCSPGEANALGLRFEALREINPHLIVTSITPFGLTGPYRDYKATDLISFHMGGVGYITPRFTEDPDQEPLRPAGRQADFNAGMNAAVATLCALRHRDLTGEGQEIDISEQETVLSMFSIYAAYYTYQGEIVSRISRPMLAPFHFLQCQDGYVMLICPEEHHWRSMLEVMGNPEWRDEPLFANSFARADNWEALEPLIADWFLSRPKEEIYRLAQEKHIPLAPVSTTADLLRAPQLISRSYFAKIDHPLAGELSYPGAPYVFSETPWQLRRPAPLLGQDNDQVLAEQLGYSATALEEFRRRGVI